MTIGEAMATGEYGNALIGLKREKKALSFVVVLHAHSTTPAGRLPPSPRSQATPPLLSSPPDSKSRPHRTETPTCLIHKHGYRQLVLNKSVLLPSPTLFRPTARPRTHPPPPPTTLSRLRQRPRLRLAGHERGPGRLSGR